MFFKKKDKGEEPAKNAKVEEPRREAPRQEAPRAAAPAPQPQQAARAPSAAPPSPIQANQGPGAAINAALTAAQGPAGAPRSSDSLFAQARAADQLAQSGDGVHKQAAKDLAAGQLDKGFDALEAAAKKISDRAAASRVWSMIGGLAFNVAAGRSRAAYEQCFQVEPRRFWDCIFLARLRGISGQIVEAHNAATAAVSAAGDDVEKGLARSELGMIALANNEAPYALQHAEESIALARRAGCGVGGMRDFVGRLVLLGDAALTVRERARSLAAYTEALGLVRRDAEAAPNDKTLAMALCEVLEKCAAAAYDQDPAAAMKFIDEAIAIRRRLQPALSPIDGKRGLAQSLTLKAELLRSGKDSAGAKAAYDESLALARQIGEAAPKDPVAQRDVWAAMWRMAVAEAGMDWRQVAGAMERMESQGALDDNGKKFLGEARRRAAA